MLVARVLDLVFVRGSTNVGVSTYDIRVDFAVAVPSGSWVMSLAQLFVGIYILMVSCH